MKVILLQDVPGTGKKDQIVNVSDGYARNYLLPRKWAMEASKGSVKEIERRNAAQRQKEMEERNAADALALSLKGKVITLRAKAGDKGRLYGSVTGQEIAQALQEQHSVEIDRRKIDVPETIRAVGEYEVQITVYAGIKTQMLVNVIAAQ